MGNIEKETIEISIEEQKTEQQLPKSTLENNTAVSMELKDMISGFVILVFGLFVLISGIRMSIISQKMSDTAWYGTPGILPIVIGAVLSALSVAMIASSYRKGERITISLLKTGVSYFKSKSFIRLAVAVLLLALYVFVLFRFLPFVASTFLYLSANMIFFREKHYPIWKLLLISGVFTLALFLFFGKIAGVPLP